MHGIKNVGLLHWIFCCATSSKGCTIHDGHPSSDWSFSEGSEVCDILHDLPKLGNTTCRSLADSSCNRRKKDRTPSTRLIRGSGPAWRLRTMIVLTCTFKLLVPAQQHRIALSFASAVHIASFATRVPLPPTSRTHGPWRVKPHVSPARTSGPVNGSRMLVSGQL